MKRQVLPCRRNCAAKAALQGTNITHNIKSVRSCMQGLILSFMCELFSM